MSSEELKPCPFCGGDVQFHKDDECSGCHYIQCGGCRAFFDFATSADPENNCESVDGLRASIAPMWNRRAETAALAAERERLLAQVSTLQPDANSWQSGYDKGREDGAKAADGWKAQHARDSAELRRLCAERDHLKACQENAQLHITGLVAERNAALKQRDKLAGLLRHASSVLGIQGWDALTHEIDTALSELTP